MITQAKSGIEVTKVTFGSACKKAAVEAILCMASGFTLPMWPVVFPDEGRRKVRITSGIALAADRRDKIPAPHS